MQNESLTKHYEVYIHTHVYNTVLFHTMNYNYIHTHKYMYIRIYDMVIIKYTTIFNIQIFPNYSQLREQSLHLFQLLNHY